jgi:hypothetical protein
LACVVYGPLPKRNQARQNMPATFEEHKTTVKDHFVTLFSAVSVPGLRSRMKTAHKHHDNSPRFFLRGHKHEQFRCSLLKALFFFALFCFFRQKSLTTCTEKSHHNGKNPFYAANSYAGEGFSTLAGL